MILHIELDMNDTTKTILTTDRLILRTWKKVDVPLMAAISSDPLVMEHFPAMQDIAATQAMVDHINQYYAKFGYALNAVETKDTHEFIGFVGLNHPRRLKSLILHRKVYPLWRLAGAYPHNIGVKDMPLKPLKQFYILPCAPVIRSSFFKISKRINLNNSILI